jgi:predicted GNAT family acetyltransferase
MQNVMIRRATADDRNFIVEAIIAAEKSNSSVLSYAGIFDLTEAAVADLLIQALEEEVEGQEICTAHFLVAEINDKLAAACASWIEAKEGVSSGQIKANLLFHLLGKTVWEQSANRLKAIAETSLERTPGAVQLEAVYTRPEFRGKGLTAKVICEHLRLHSAQPPAPTKAQVILLKANTIAAGVYRKIGFEKIAEQAGTSALLRHILPSPVKIMMQKQL